MLLLLNATGVHLLILKGPLPAYYTADAMAGTTDMEVTVSSSSPSVTHGLPGRQTDEQTLAVGVRNFKMLYPICINSD